MFYHFQDSGWEQVNLEIASSRKFKWLRERMFGSSPHTTLLNQIKNFVLTDEVDVTSLHSCLGRQVRQSVANLTVNLKTLLLLCAQSSIHVESPTDEQSSFIHLGSFVDIYL